MPKDLFCDFRTATMGSCGVYTGGGRCLKHLNKKEIIKVKAKKYRGDSHWGSENGYFNNK